MNGLTHLRDSTESNEQLREQLPINMNNEEDISRARELLRAEQNLESTCKTILHFPFDRRFIFYHDALVERTRRNVMGHLLAGENVAMCVGRTGRVTGDPEWNLVSVSQAIANYNLFRRGGMRFLPLYCYAEHGGPRFHNISPLYYERSADILPMKLILLRQWASYLMEKEICTRLLDRKISSTISMRFARTRVSTAIRGSTQN